MDVVWAQRHLWLSRFYTKKSGGSSKDLGQRTISGGERLPNMLLHLVDGCIFILKFLKQTDQNFIRISWKKGKCYNDKHRPVYMHVYGFMADYIKVNNINTSCSDQ